MKNLQNFEEFLNEATITLIKEDLDKDGLPFVLSHALKESMGIKPFKGYRDADPSSYDKTLFSVFYYDAGWPRTGLKPSFFDGRVPGTYMGEIAKSAKNYLKSGKAEEALIEFLASIYYYDAPGGRGQNLDNDRKRITDCLTAENAKNPTVISALNTISEALKSYATGTAAARLNLAVAVNRVFRYSGYAGSNFTRVYQMAVEGLRKNKVKLTPDSKIVFHNEQSSIGRETISNSIGFSQVDINRWSSYVTATVDGKEYVIGSFESSSGYGRY